MGRGGGGGSKGRATAVPGADWSDARVRMAPVLLHTIASERAERKHSRERDCSGGKRLTLAQCVQCQRMRATLVGIGLQDAGLGLPVLLGVLGGTVPEVTPQTRRVRGSAATRVVARCSDFACRPGAVCRMTHFQAVRHAGAPVQCAAWAWIARSRVCIASPDPPRLRMSK